MKYRTLLLLACFAVSPLFAQEKLKVSPIGRILVDAGCFESKVEGLNNGKFTKLTMITKAKTTV